MIQPALRGELEAGDRKALTRLTRKGGRAGRKVVGARVPLSGDEGQFDVVYAHKPRRWLTSPGSRSTSSSASA